jgi:hypothetical protein
MARAYSILIALVILATLAFFLATLSEPAVTLNTLACGTFSLCIVQAVSVAIAPSRFAINFNNSRALSITGLTQEASLTITMGLVVLDDTFTVIGASIASLVCRALKIACFANPSWLAVTFGVHVADNLTFSIIGTHIVYLVSWACKEAVVAFETIVAGTLSSNSTLIQFALPMVRACTKVTSSARTWDRAILAKESTFTFAGWLESFVYSAFAAAMAQLGVLGRPWAQQITFFAQETFLTDADCLFLIV